MANDEHNKDNNFLLIMVILILSGIIAVFLIAKKMQSGALMYYGFGAIILGVVGIIEELCKRSKK